ncbi:unnamed protein product, partial [marine sediment metagenome]
MQHDVRVRLLDIAVNDLHSIRPHFVERNGEAG